MRSSPTNPYTLIFLGTAMLCASCAALPHEFRAGCGSAVVPQPAAREAVACLSFCADDVASVTCAAAGPQPERNAKAAVLPSTGSVKLLIGPSPISGENLAQFLAYSSGWQVEAAAAVRNAAIIPIRWQGTVAQLNGLSLRTRGSGRVVVHTVSDARTITLSLAS